MARSLAEIQADIALTRRLIEQDVDALRARLDRPPWGPAVVVGSVVLAGVVLARLPVGRLLVTGARAIRAGLSLATTVAVAGQVWRRRRGR